MAFARRLASGLSQGVSDVMMMLLKNRAAERQGVQKELDEIDPKFVQSYGPEAAQARAEGLKRRLSKSQQAKLQTPDYATYDAPAAARIGPAMKRASTFAKPEDAPSQDELSGMLSEARLPTGESTSTSSMMEGTGGSGQLPPMPTFAIGKQTAQPADELSKLLAQVERRQGLLEENAPVTDVSSVENGVTVTRPMTQKQQREAGARRTSQTPEEKANEARATAAGSREGTLGVDLAPENITREASRQGQITSATEQGKRDVANLPANQTAEARQQYLNRRAQLEAEMKTMGMTGQQQSAALSLSDDFEGATKDFYAIRSAYNNIQGLASQDSPAADIAIVFGFMKALDPGSTVREGEAATVRNAAGIPERVRRAYNQAISGEGLTPEQRMDFVKTGKMFYDAAQADFNDTRTSFVNRAREMKVPPSLVIREPTVIQSPLEKLRSRAGAQ